MIDIKTRDPNGKIVRVRRVSPNQTRSGARRYQHEIREQILSGRYCPDTGKAADPPPPPPTLDAWQDTFIREHSEAKGLRPSTIREQRSVFRLYLLPLLAATPVTEIRTPHFHRVRSAMASRGLSPKTVNNALSVLSRSTRFYYQRNGLDVPHFDASMAKVPKPPPKFWEPGEYEALVDAAAELGPRELALLLLMGDCGLRTGEVIALEWTHLRWQPEPQIVVQRSYAAGHFGPPKGARPRTVPMTSRTIAALQALPRALHLAWVSTRATKRGPEHETRGSLAWLVFKAERAAELPRARGYGQLHKLRHSFVTRLAAAGAPARSIMELAGHTNLSTTLRYMHMVPGEASRAVSILEKFDQRTPRGAPVGAPPLLGQA